jgi:hypothetical protein
MTTAPVFKQWEKQHALESAATVSRHSYIKNAVMTLKLSIKK